MPIFYRFRDITIYWSKICVSSPFLPNPDSLEANSNGVFPMVWKFGSKPSMTVHVNWIIIIGWLNERDVRVIVAEEEADRLYVGADCAALHCQLVSVLRRSSLSTRRRSTPRQRHSYYDRYTPTRWLQVLSSLLLVSLRSPINNTVQSLLIMAARSGDRRTLCFPHV